MSIHGDTYIFEGTDTQLDILKQILDIKIQGRLDIEAIKNELKLQYERDLEAAKLEEKKHFKISLETLPPINPLIQNLIIKNKKDLDIIVFGNKPDPKQSMSFFIS